MVLLVIFIMLIVSGVSYAYFTATITSNANTTIITSGNMSLKYTDGPEVRLDNAIPGDTVIKTFSITNTGTVSTAYDVYLSEVANEFADPTDLAYSIASNDGGYNTISDVQVPLSSSKIISSYNIEPNTTQNYILTIKFLAKDTNQDINQGKSFSAKLQINEFSDIEPTVNYYINDTLVNDLPQKLNYVTYDSANSSCSNSVTLTFDTDSWLYSTSRVTKKDTVCNLKFNMSVLSYAYTGNIETFTVPSNGYYELDAWGASGQYATRGLGAYTSGKVLLTKGDNIYINVGTYNDATDYRLESTNLNSRIMVAAAGGSGMYTSECGFGYDSAQGGYGGALIGGSGASGTKGTAVTITTGGTQLSGGNGGTGNEGNGKPGSFGQLGTNCWGYDSTMAGQGGNGYFGGGGSARAWCNGGSGAGGSSYISGYLGSVAVESSTSTSPRKDSLGTVCTTSSAASDITCSYHYSNIIFMNNIMKSGNEIMPNHAGTGTMTGNDGNGYSRITFIGTSLN